MVALALFAMGTGAIEAVEKNPSGLEENVLKKTSVSIKDSLNQGELKKLAHDLRTTNPHNLQRIVTSYIPHEKRENICREIGVPSMNLQEVHQRIRSISLGDLVGILSTQDSPEELKNIFRDIQEGEDRYQRIRLQSKAMLDFLGTKDEDFLKK